MADNEQQTAEQLSNDIMEEVFQDLHLSVVNNINASPVIDRLFAAKVISDADINNLNPINHPLQKCRHLLNILHNRKHPRAFIELRQAIHDEDTYDWLVEEIDEKYKLLASASAQPQVARDRSNTSLTSLDDIAKLNLVIDDLRKENATLKTKNSKLVEENATLKKMKKRKKSRLVKDITTLTAENSRLVEANARLKDKNNRLCLERSSAEDEKRKMVETIEDLENKLQRVQISRSKSYTKAPLYSRKVVTCMTLIFGALHYLWYGLIQHFHNFVLPSSPLSFSFTFKSNSFPLPSIFFCLQCYTHLGLFFYKCCDPCKKRK